MRSNATATSATATATGSRFRQRKLNVKAHLQIVRESDLENGDLGIPDEISERHEPLTSLPKVESGVEQKEEKEHHLQAVISASAAAAVGGKVAQIYIPTPDAVPSDIKYDGLYPPTFAQPATYIRFSSTVEDSVGVPYCMTVEDEDALQTINAGLPKTAPCTEDEFEEVMNFFEEMSQERQPYAAVDNTPVLRFDEMEAGYDESMDEDARRYASVIYEYWKDRRTQNGNKSIVAKLKTLKMETAQDTDDSDPYVCFRRREVRQPRKTRGRDAQIVDKVKKLRKELEEARHIMDLVKRRELGRRDDLDLSRQVFEQRKDVREMKRALGIHDDADVLLVNQRTPKKAPLEPSQGNRQPSQPSRATAKPDTSGIPEFDIVYLRDKLFSREQNIAAKISKQISQHENWNLNYVDRTEEAVLGIYQAQRRTEIATNGFVGVRLGFSHLPTPPLSVASESPSDNEGLVDLEDELRMRWARPSENTEMRRAYRYRARLGRGGRLLLDRRRPISSGLAANHHSYFGRYDHDSDSESDDQLNYPDPLSLSGLRYREHLRQKEQASLREQSQAHRRTSSLRDTAIPVSQAPVQRES